MTNSGKAVFLSYASQDAEAARRLCEALRAAGVEVWFDQSELVGGDAWDAKIRKQIRDCALFVPVISAATQARLEGYFRLEWKLAAQRTHTMAEAKPFLVPVVIDGTRDAEAHVPAEFTAVQWSRIAIRPEQGAGGTGQEMQAFIAQVQRLLGQGNDASPVGPALAPGRIEGKRPAASGGPTRGVFAVAALVLLAAGAWFWSSRSANSALPSPAKAPAPTTGALPPLPTDKSIAVLPFENMSDDKEDTSFTDGMHESILTTLFNVREFRLAGLDSVLPYQGTTKPILQIGRELNMAYILRGTIRRAGTTVRITGRLVEARTGAELWRNQFDRELTAQNLFAIESTLATEIAAALKTTLSPAEKTLVERRPTGNLAAYDAYLDWKKEMNTNGLTTSSMRLQVTILDKAVGLDPNFAEAWAALAMLHSRLWANGARGMLFSTVKAQEAIGNATRLAPNSPAVILNQGWFYFYALRDFERAGSQFEKLIALQPNNSETDAALASVRVGQGRWIEAVTRLKRAIEHDPANWIPAYSLVDILLAGRRYDEAAAELARLIDRRRTNGDYPDDLKLRDRYNLALVSFYATGSKKEVEAFFAGLAPDQSNSPRGLFLRREWAYLTGDNAEGVRLDQIQPNFAGADLAPWSQAIIGATMRAALGDREGARIRLGDYPAMLRGRAEDLTATAGNLSQLAHMEALLDQPTEAMRDAIEATKVTPESMDARGGPAASFNLAIVHAWTGDKEGAFAEIARLLRVTNGSPGVHILRNSARTFPLHGDPRFEALLNDPKNYAPLF